METHLRNIKKAKKGIGGKEKGKLTDKLIKDLSIYYGLSIRRHCNNLKDMQNAIWAMFYHKCSTDKKPQHSLCPPGQDSWCSWRRAEAEGTLRSFKHSDPPLSDAVQAAIKPVYEHLSSDSLLEKCLGGFT